MYNLTYVVSMCKLLHVTLTTILVIVAHCVQFSFIFLRCVNLSKPNRADLSAERNLSASVKHHMVTKMELNLKRHFAQLTTKLTIYAPLHASILYVLVKLCCKPY